MQKGRNHGDKSFGFLVRSFGCFLAFSRFLSMVFKGFWHFSRLGFVSLEPFWRERFSWVHRIELLLNWSVLSFLESLGRGSVARLPSLVGCLFGVSE